MKLCVASALLVAGLAACTPPAPAADVASAAPSAPAAVPATDIVAPDAGPAAPGAADVLSSASAPAEPAPAQQATSPAPATPPAQTTAPAAPVSATPAEIENGRSAYTRTCAMCHGPRGEGTPAGSPIVSRDPAAIANKVVKGVVNPGERMPAMSGMLSAEEIDDVSKFVAAGLPQQ